MAKTTPGINTPSGNPTYPGQGSGSWQAFLQWAQSVGANILDLPRLQALYQQWQSSGGNPPQGPTPGGETSGAGPVGQDPQPTGKGPGMPGTGKGTTPGTLPNTNPNAGNTPSNITDFTGATAAANAANAEKAREFDITTARDIAKQSGTEVDALQQRLAALSGPKDAYADYFFAHGLLPPQGYKPAPVPLTQAQIDAYGRMGVTPQALQGMIAGTGQPGADFGMLGSMGQSLSTPAGMPQPIAGQAPQTPQAPVNPTMQGGALFGKTPTVPGTGGTPPAVTPGGVPSMAVGGQVPGAPGTPTLAVLHGGEQVTPAPGTSSGQPPSTAPSMSPGQAGVTGSQPPATPGMSGQGSMMNNPGLHPAIAALVDAVSGLLSNPDFRPFVAAASQTPQATPGGVQSMALGGTVQQGGIGGGSNILATEQATGRNPTVSNAQGGLLQNTPPTATPQPPQPSVGMTSQPLGTKTPVVPSIGTPMAGAQSVIYNTGAPSPKDNPIMPLANMDPYSRALYDVHGRLHPYSAQQQQQMGPAGIDAITSYVSKVQGGDIKAYQDLVDRLKPQGAAPTASTGTATEGFSFG